MMHNPVLRTIDDAISELSDAFDTLANDILKRKSFEKDLSAPGERNFEHHRLRVDEDKKRIKQVLAELIRHPPHHQPDLEAVKRFYDKGGTYDTSVFIMTKFPRDKDDKSFSDEDRKLHDIIRLVIENLTEKKYKPRIASEKHGNYHPQLWNNVKTYLFCCKRGVAIVEDKYQAEWNPNVAMEWGWMRAMDKPVLFLVEEEFAHWRADLEGFISTTFSWGDPEPGIKQAIESNFLEIKHSVNEAAR